MGENKTNTLIFLTSKRSREISFSRKNVIFFLTLIGLFLVSLIAGSTYFGFRYLASSQFTSPKIKNKALLKTVEELKLELANTEAYLDSMVELNNHIRMYADLPQHDLKIENLGVGGRTQMFDPSNSDNDIDKLDAEIAFLCTKVSVELENYKNLYVDIQKYKERLDYIPAITPLNTEKYWVSSPFGYRSDPFTETKKFHSGIDLAAKRGTPVHATGKGVVIYAQMSYGGYGNLVKVDHGDGIVTKYAHLYTISVKKGDVVERGQIVGKVGTTGRSTGPHLHYEVNLNGKAVNPVRYMWDDDA
jgi:murein DD-endopeptidase MepM/ murein hydrolase activator NlpD